MAKRFTDTDKWKKGFFKSIPLEYKLFWLYILDDCDHAGIWYVDFEIAEIRLGTKLSKEKARGFFAGRVVEFDSGTKWFIPDFIGFQYGNLTEKNKMSKPVFSLLSKYSLMGHLSPINGVQVQVQVKDKEELDDLQRGEKLLPKMLNVYLQTFPQYPPEQTKDFPALLEIAGKIAERKKIPKSEMLDRREEILQSWEKIVGFLASDRWFSTRCISDLVVEWQRIVMSMKPTPVKRMVI